MHKVTNQLVQKKTTFLIALWVIVQFSILYSHGINSNGEAFRFIREARHLINHQPFSTPIYFMYLIEILLIFIKIKFSFSYGFIVAIQLLLNLVALLSLKRFVYSLYGSEKLSLIAASILTICIPYQFFNSYVYTESIFFSLSIIFSCFLLNIKEFNTKNLINVSLWLLLLCLTRPTGIFFISATFMVYFLKATGGMSLLKRMILFSAITIFFIFLLNNMMGSGKGVNVISPFREEHIICDVPTVITAGTQQPDDNSILGLLTYILKHPRQFIKMSLLKTIAFFGLNRTYFSLIHNLFTDIYFYSLYLLIILGIVQWKTNKSIHFVYYFSLVFIFWMLVVFSCDEWNNRFFLTLTPFLILMALPAISKWFKKQDS